MADPPPRSPRRPRSAEAGFSLLEVMIASVILVVVIGIALLTLARGQRAYDYGVSLSDVERTARSIYDAVNRDVRWSGTDRSGGLCRVRLYETDDPGFGYPLVVFQKAIDFDSGQIVWSDEAYVYAYDAATETARFGIADLDARWTTAEGADTVLPQDPEANLQAEFQTGSDGNPGLIIGSNVQRMGFYWVDSGLNTSDPTPATSLRGSELTAPPVPGIMISLAVGKRISDGNWVFHPMQSNQPDPFSEPSPYDPMVQSVILRNSP